MTSLMSQSDSSLLKGMRSTTLLIVENETSLECISLLVAREIVTLVLFPNNHRHPGFSEVPILPNLTNGMVQGPCIFRTMPHQCALALIGAPDHADFFRQKSLILLTLEAYPCRMCAFKHY